MTTCHAAFAVSETSQVGEVRRHVARMAAELGFDEAGQSNASIVATELSNNLVRHTPGGEILMRAVTVGVRVIVEMVSVDRGPGMASVAQCMEDGFSTRGGAGTGMGAMQRLADEFDIYSTKPGGTVVFARVGPSGAPKPQAAGAMAATGIRWAGISRPAPYEELCGDDWMVADRDSELAVVVADGLGHGPLAAQAADAVIRAFAANPFGEMSSQMASFNSELRGTRGSAAAVARLDCRRRQLAYLGVGNIVGSLRKLDGSRGRGLVSHNGTLGVEARTRQPFLYELDPESLLVMHSDGLQSRWMLENYPGLAMRHPGVIAGVLYRDFTRGKDDVTVVVVRLSAKEGGLK